MTGKFDPYHRWLGIPVTEQPANHYRLLGLVAFEDDPEVIRDAAERQMVHVRGYALGQYSELSQKILNELAAAKACLLNPERRAAYAALHRVHIPPRPTDLVPPDDIYGLASATPPVKSEATAPGRPQPPICVDTSTPGPRPVAHPVRPFKAKKASGFRWGFFFLQVGCFAVVLLLLVGGVTFIGQLWTTPMTLGERPKSQQAGQSQPAATTVADAKSPDAQAIRPPKLTRIPNQKTDSNAVVAKPPVLHPVQQQTVACGRRSQFPMRVADADRRAGDIVYSLTDAPRWVSIDVATGVVTCEPSPTQSPGAYSVSVRAANSASEGLHDDKTFTIVVLATNSPRGEDGQLTNREAQSAPPDRSESPLGNAAIVPPGAKVGRSQQKPIAAKVAAKTQLFEIELPSGEMLTSDMIDTRAMVHREIDMLLQKCRARSPDAIGIYQEGSDSAIAVLASIKNNKLGGPAIVFYNGRGHETPSPKQYVVIRNDEWCGTVATWDERSQRTFWGNYANGQRHGLCCLFADDALTAVLECTRDKTDAIHLITANQITESFMDAEAMTDEVASRVLEQVDAIEKDANETGRSVRGRLKQGVQAMVGAANAQKREAFGERAAGRANANDQSIKGLRRAAGLP